MDDVRTRHEPKIAELTKTTVNTIIVGIQHLLTVLVSTEKQIEKRNTEQAAVTCPGHSNTDQTKPMLNTVVLQFASMYFHTTYWLV